MTPSFLRTALAALAFIAPGLATAVEVRFVPVAEGVYADVGDMGARTTENEGLNANIGLVVTSNGAVLIDSGATLAPTAPRRWAAVANEMSELH